MMPEHQLGVVTTYPTPAPRDVGREALEAIVALDPAEQADLWSMVLRIRAIARNALDGMADAP